ncbi:MAG TPA: hypothetical protein VFQ67_10455 [Allosphingosinicella sp.]|jgi:hypothetical protein|nr:hypothetical protein [Allosphingosinicella sp.]
MLTCSPDRPWGLHNPVRNDEDCPRCGWTAPGPKGDALADAAEAAAEARARAAALGWTVHCGDPAEAIAA